MAFWPSSDLILKINKVKVNGSLEMFVSWFTSKQIMRECSFCGHKVSLYPLMLVAQ